MTTDQSGQSGQPDAPATGSVVDVDGPVPGGAFDEHHPPDAALVGDCVHCGFCLPTCPTYVLWGEEMDSPRGRIYLMKQGLEGEPMSDSMVEHWDACLGCMACVTACPSGVQYDTLIEQTRAQVERRHERSRGDRALRGFAEKFDGRAGKSYAESLALFGQPLSPPQTEELAPGVFVTVQWFERARFEDHGAGRVLLGLLGNELVQRRGWR